MGGCVSKKSMTSTENIIKANVDNSRNRNSYSNTNSVQQQIANVNFNIKLMIL
jgi:hypothetical protein